MRRVGNKTLLSFILALLTLTWVSAVAAGMPGMFSQWPGFHASEKAYPGWSEYDQDRTLDTLSVTQEQAQEQGYGSYQGFQGAKEGSYPGGRPNGK
jgi:hypothetical protein